MLANVQRFGKSTSMKGVPRILTSESVCLRTVWICAVISFFVFGFYQVTLFASCLVPLVLPKRQI